MIIWGSGAPAALYNNAPLGALYIDGTNGTLYVKTAAAGTGASGAGVGSGRAAEGSTAEGVKCGNLGPRQGRDAARGDAQSQRSCGWR